MIFRLSRNYYRCAYRERKCLATKTIEQQEQNNAGTSSAIAGVENAKYTVVYYGDHTCKDHNISRVLAPSLLIWIFKTGKWLKQQQMFKSLRQTWTCQLY